MVNIAEWACRAAGVAMPWGRLPPDIEVSQRRGAGRNLWIIINHGAHERRLRLPIRNIRALTGVSAAEELFLPGNEVLVLAGDER
jgi:hypothetical protein